MMGKLPLLYLGNDVVDGRDEDGLVWFGGAEWFEFESVSACFVGVEFVAFFCEDNVVIWGWLEVVARGFAWIRDSRWIFDRS